MQSGRWPVEFLLPGIGHPPAVHDWRAAMDRAERAPAPRTQDQIQLLYLNSGRALSESLVASRSNIRLSLISRAL